MSSSSSDGRIALQLQRIADALELRLISMYCRDEDTKRAIIDPIIEVYCERWQELLEFEPTLDKET